MTVNWIWFIFFSKLKVESDNLEWEKIDFCAIKRWIKENFMSSNVIMLIVVKGINA